MHVSFQNESIENLLGPNNQAKERPPQSKVISQSLFLSHINYPELADHEIQ
jgi:hypothetical protein